MNLSRAVLHISHYNLIQSKLNSLEIELKQATNNERGIVKETNILESKIRHNEAEFEQKKADMLKAFTEKQDDYNRQVKYHEELLRKKNEERESQLAYLSELNVCEKSYQDLNNFNWSTLKKIASNGEKNDIQEKQYQKAVETNMVSEQAQVWLEKLFTLYNSTEDTRYALTTRIADMHNNYANKWRAKIADQLKTIGILETENCRLSLIIKQCITNNEPMSENITRNVRDKCHSFMNSTNVGDLLQGLKKYHRRQENKIKLLRRKANKLSCELSHLQVASDQTADLIHHYLTMINANNNNRLLAYNPSRIHPTDDF